MDKELGVADFIFSQSGNGDFGWPVTKLKPPAIILLQTPHKCIGTGWGNPKIQTRKRYHGQGIGGCRFHFFTKWEWWFWVVAIFGSRVQRAENSYLKWSSCFRLAVVQVAVFGSREPKTATWGSCFRLARAENSYLCEPKIRTRAEKSLWESRKQLPASRKQLPKNERAENSYLM